MKDNLNNKKNNSRATAAIATTILTAAVIIMAATSSMMMTAVSVTATTTTNATTTTPPTVGQEEHQQQATIHITKHSTNSYTISGEMSSVGTFDTTYRIAGERSAIRSAEDLIISTITDDFRNSPTIGYILAVNMTMTGGAADNTTATLPNPFATPEQITERITSELRRVITEAAEESNSTTIPPQQPLPPHVVEIKCDFGMILDEMKCSHHVPSVSVGAIEEAAFPTNLNDQITDLVPD